MAGRNFRFRGNGNSVRNRRRGYKRRQHNRPSVDYRHDSFDAVPLFPGLPITGQGPGGGSGDWSMWQMAMNNGTPGTHQGDQGMWMQSREAHGCCTPAGGCGCGCICGRSCMQCFCSMYNSQHPRYPGQDEDGNPCSTNVLY